MFKKWIVFGLSIVLCCVIALSGAAVFAGTDDNGGTVNRPRGNVLEEALSAMVSDGIITQDNADKMLEYIEKFRKERLAECKQKMKKWVGQMPGRVPGLLERRLVADGVLTREEADALTKAIKDIFTDMKDGEDVEKPDKGEILKKALSQLVEQNVLTQDKADKVLEYFDECAQYMKNPGMFMKPFKPGRRGIGPKWQGQEGAEQ